MKNKIREHLQRRLGLSSAVTILFCVFLFPAVLFAQANFLLSPPILDLAIAPGGMQDFTLFIHNDSDQENTFRIYPTDIVVSPVALKFPEAGTTKFSCAKWINLQEPTFMIAPHKSKEIQGRINIPRKDFGGRYAVVMCEKVDEDRGQNKQMIEIRPRFRLGTIIKLTIKSRRTKKDIQIEDMRIDHTEGGLEVKADLLNTGNIHTITKGHFIIKDGENKIKARGLFPEATSYPESKTELKHRLRKNLAAGAYLIEAKIDYGGKRRVSLRKDFILEKAITTEYDVLKERVALSLDPSLLEVFLPAGSFKLYPVTILNKEPFKAKISIVLSDFQIKEDGEIEYLEPGASANSCASWIEVKPDEFEVLPGAQKKFRITINPPRGIQKIGYAKLVLMVNFFEKHEVIKSDTKDLTIIAGTIKDAGEDGEILEWHLSPREKEAIGFHVRFKNKGERYLFPQISFTILDKESKEMSKGRFPGKRLLFPGAIANFTLTHPLSLEEGEYRAQVKAKFGKEEKIITSKKVFKIQ